jgi:hypothetical protein
MNKNATIDEVAQLVSLKTVYQAICKFRADTCRNPRKIYLTEHEIACLNMEIRNRLIAEREHDLKERLRPDLLPPMRETRYIGYHDYVYGVQIVPRETGEIKG